MKNWFSIVCYLVATMYFIFLFISVWFLDDEIWYIATQTFGSLSFPILLMIIGEASWRNRK